MMEGRNNSVVIILTTTELYHFVAVFETEKEHFRAPFRVWRRTTLSATRCAPTPAAALRSRLASACCPDLLCVFVLSSFGRLRADQAWDSLTHFAGSRPLLSPKQRDELSLVSALAEDMGLEKLSDGPHC